MIPPTQMRTHFTANEIGRTAQIMKSDKSPGCEEISHELIKYSPEIICKKIVNILNNIAETADTLREVTHDLLNSLLNPEKLKEPQSKQRSTIWISTIREILAACIMLRIRGRMVQWDSVSALNWKIFYSNPTGVLCQGLEPNLVTRHPVTFRSN